MVFLLNLISIIYTFWLCFSLFFLLLDKRIAAKTQAKWMIFNVCILFRLCPVKYLQCVVQEKPWYCPSQNKWHRQGWKWQREIFIMVSIKINTHISTLNSNNKPQAKYSRSLRYINEFTFVNSGFAYLCGFYHTLHSTWTYQQNANILAMMHPPPWLD